MLNLPGKLTPAALGEGISIVTQSAALAPLALRVVQALQTDARARIT